MKSLESESALFAKQKEFNIARSTSEVEVEKIKLMGEADNQLLAKQAEYAFKQSQMEDEQKIADASQRREIELIREEASAFKEKLTSVGPQLVAAVTRYGDQQLISEASKNIGPMSALEGKAVMDILARLFKGLPFAARDLDFLKSPLEKSDENNSA